MVVGVGSGFSFWVLGYVGAAGVVYLLPNWRDAWLALALPTLSFAAFAFGLPESPLWLACNGRETEARKV